MNFIIILIISLSFDMSFCGELNSHKQVTSDVEDNDSDTNLASLSTSNEGIKNGQENIKYLIYKLIFKKRLQELMEHDDDSIDNNEQTLNKDHPQLIDLDVDELNTLLNYIDEVNNDEFGHQVKRGSIYKPRQGRSPYNKYKPSNSWYFRRMVDKKAYYKPRMGK